MSGSVTDLVARARRIETIEQIDRFATSEARAARLPGWTNGPADAYRHLVLVGEMTRRFGREVATAIAEANEFTSSLTMWRDQRAGREVAPANRPEARSMDRHNNNRVGPVIGRAADSPEDVVAGARRAIEQAAAYAGSGLGDTARWHERALWVDDGAGDNWPSPTWPDIASSPAIRVYRDHAGLPTASHMPVDQPTPPADSGDGPVAVRPHHRGGHPVQGYLRSQSGR